MGTGFGGPPDYFTPNQSMPDPSMAFSACSNAVAPYGCPFNLSADPTEHVDLALQLPEVLAELMADFAALNASYHPPLIVPADESAQLCAVAAENDNIAAPWRSQPLPQDM